MPFMVYYVAEGKSFAVFVFHCDAASVRRQPSAAPPVCGNSQINSISESIELIFFSRIKDPSASALMMFSVVSAVLHKLVEAPHVEEAGGVSVFVPGARASGGLAEG